MQHTLRISCLLFAILLGNRELWPQGPVGDGIQAGVEAYQQAEANRQQAVSQQAGQNEFYRYRPMSYDFYGNAAYYHRGYGNGIPAMYYSNYGEYRSGYRYAPFATGYSIVGGYNVPPPMIRQPIGRREIQTGPNRWESFPVYAEDDFRPVHPQPASSGPREF